MKRLAMHIECAALVWLALAATVSAQTNWPQFRGPGSRGVADNEALPDRWSATENIAWKTDIPGRGWSSPVVWGNRLFLTTVVNLGESETPRKGLYVGGERPTPPAAVHQWKVFCLELDSGRVLWERQVHEGKPATSIHLKNSYASETPVTDGQRVYCYFGNIGVFCFDLDGNEIWRHEVAPHVMRSGWGTAASPVVHEDRLYLVNDNNEDSYLLALDTKTGAEVWRTPRDEKSNWSTPFIWQNDLRTEIVTLGTGQVRSYDLAGQLLWSLAGMSSITIATPYEQGGLLYFSSGFVMDSLRPIYAVRPGASGDISLQPGQASNAWIVWCQAKAAPYNPSTLVYQDQLYVLLDRGLVSSYRAQDGSDIYSAQRLPKGGAFTASPWAYGGKVFCLNEDGITFVLKAGNSFELLHTNALADDDMCMATPAIAGNKLLIRTASRVVCIQSPAATDASSAKPVLDLPLEENLTDTSPLNRTCIAHGEIPFEDGKRGRCVAFVGQSWIDTGIAQQELGDEFTIECWVKPDRQQNPYADIFGNHVSEGLGIVLQQDGLNTNHFYAAYGAGSGKWVMTDAVPLAAGRWQHVAMVKSGDRLRLFLNSVLVAEVQDAATPLPSPMNVAVGVGYTAPERCFRGQIDDFRIWKGALTSFEHAEIDVAAARETSAQYLDTTPRPVAGALTQSWTLATDDTHLTLGVTAEGDLVVSELSNPQAGWNWITRPVAFGLLPHVEVAEEIKTLRWRFVDAVVDEIDGRKLTLRFACDDPAMELTSQWHAGQGPGPIRHCLSIANRSADSVTIPEQPTFDLDLTGATSMYYFHSDGGTPDGVGVYRRPLADVPAGQRYSVQTAPTGAFIPFAVCESNERHGVYVGLEWSFCRIETVTISGAATPIVRVRGGNVADLRAELGPGESLAVRPGFVGTYCGDLDDAGNRLRRWLMRYGVPAILREDPGYPKVQWNAFGAAGKTPGSWDPVEQKYYPLIDDIAPLGFEEVMIDVAWWEGDEPVADRVDWSSGMKQAAEYAHERGLRFGLYWTDNLEMANLEARRQRADRVARLFREYGADMWRSDSTRGEVISSSFAATQGFYEMVDTLAKEIPEFQWENCSGGGRIKDYGAMRRAVKIFNSDTYSPLHVRQAFYDSAYAFHPAQLEGHLGSTDGRYRPVGVAGMKYAFRSMSMGAPEWFLDAPNGGNGSAPWTQDEKDAVKACVETYKTRIRPLVRQADLYHILPRPDGRNWDGLEYYDPLAGRGVVFLFKPSSEIATQLIQFRGLDEKRMYRLNFEDGSHPVMVKPAAELVNEGLQLILQGEETSELVFFEIVQ